jgi:hypothetical protein
LDGGTILATVIQQESCIAVSDGSFKDQHGTAAWVMEAETSRGCIVGDCVTPGNPSDQSAYRSEIAGLFAIGLMASVLCEHHHIQSGRITIGCDGLSALLNSSTDEDFIVQATRPHYDLLLATRTILQSAPIQWTAHHVKGHQDDDLTAILDRWAVLNIEMDARAKTYWSETIAKPLPRQFSITGEPWALWIGPLKVCRDVATTIISHVHGPPCQEYWATKNNFGAATRHVVDWFATNLAMRAAPIHCRHWISKHSTGICGTSKMMKRWGKRLTDTCPRCPEVEDVSHVWTCQAPAATHIWQAAINGLQIWFREQKKQLPALLTQFVHGYVHGTVLHLMSHRSLITLGCERFLSSKIYWVGWQ